MFAIYKKEMRTYLNTPVAYVYLIILFVILGIFTLVSCFYSDTNFNSILGGVWPFTVFIIPILTMKLLSDEKRNKTDQLLFTTQISSTSVVLGKYFAVMSVILFSVVISFIYPILIYKFSGAQYLPWLSGYIGFFLLALLFSAISLLASALTESQAVAGVLGSGIIFLMWLFEAISSSVVKSKFFVDALNYFAIVSKFESFLKGSVQLSSIVYYVSFIVVILVLTVIIIEKRRWK